MKAKVLSLLVPTLLVADAANATEIYSKDGNKLDLYGKADGLRYFPDNKGNDGGKTYMCIGFKGKTQANDQLTSYGQREYQIQDNQSEANNDAWTCAVFAGLKFADAGSSSYGRNYGVTYGITFWTDVLPELGGDTYGVDSFMQQHDNDYVAYRNTDFFGLVGGLNFTLQYQGRNGSVSGESVGGHSLLTQSDDGYSGSMTYGIGTDFDVGGAITMSKRTADQNVAGVYGSDDHATVYIGDLKYDANDVCLVVQYSRSYNVARFDTSGGSNPTAAYSFTDKAQNSEVVVQYRFGFGLHPSVAYLQLEGKDINNGFTNYGDQDIVKYVNVSATYYFDKNMFTYVDYEINLLDDNNFTHDAGIAIGGTAALGLIYQF